MVIGNGVGFWNIIPTRERSKQTSCSGERIFSPSSNTSPSIFLLGYSLCILLHTCISVDLPQPDGPMKAVTLFGKSGAVTLRTATSSTFLPFFFFLGG